MKPRLGTPMGGHAAPLITRPSPQAPIHCQFCRSNYNYSLRISEERCKPFARPVTQGRAYQEVGRCG